MLYTKRNALHEKELVQTTETYIQQTALDRVNAIYPTPESLVKKINDHYAQQATLPTTLYLYEEIHVGEPNSGRCYNEKLEPIHSELRSLPHGEQILSKFYELFNQRHIDALQAVNDVLAQYHFYAEETQEDRGSNSTFDVISNIQYSFTIKPLLSQRSDALPD